MLLQTFVSLALAAGHFLMTIPPHESTRTVRPVGRKVEAHSVPTAGLIIFHFPFIGVR